LGLTPLGARNAQFIVLPIDIIKAMLRDFALAQTVDREQHQDNAVTHTRWTTRIEPRKKPLYIRPIGPRR